MNFKQISQYLGGTKTADHILEFLKGAFNAANSLKKMLWSQDFSYSMFRLIGPVDPHIFADPEPGSQNVANLTDPNPEPIVLHSRLIFLEKKVFLKVDHNCEEKLQERFWKPRKESHFSPQNKYHVISTGHLLSVLIFNNKMQQPINK